MPRTNSGRRYAQAFLLPLLILVAWIVACSGDNAFNNPVSPNPGGGGAPAPVNPDTIRPSVEFELPDENATVAVGDSVFVQVRVTDNEALATVELQGFALRGDPDLGTQQLVGRYATKTADLRGRTPAVRDTSIIRYLLATDDTVPEAPIYLVAIATDTAGNSSADTLRIAIGGPRVEIAAPASGAEVRAGTPLSVRVTAGDRLDRVRSVRLRASGAMARDTTITFSSLLEEVDTAFVLVLPADGTGDLHLDAFATNSRNVEATGRRVSLRVLAPSADQTPPTVRFESQVRARAEVHDTLTVTVTATDDTQVDSVGVTVAAVRRVGANVDTLAVATQRARASQSTFRFQVGAFGLPPTVFDTMTVSYEITAFARDVAGNCAAATVPDVSLVEPCRTGSDGSVFSDRSGSRQDVLIVRGVTVRRSSPLDRYADITSDGARIIVSNFSRNRLDVFAIGERQFSSIVPVGSEPWGLAVSRGRDTLFVANSGGTNISVVPIVPGALSETGRIRTSDIRLYAVGYNEENREVGGVTMLDYSDRPQFIGQTSHGQLLYSTKPTPTRSDGTIRIFNPLRDTTYAFNRGSEIFVDYARRTEGQAIVVNALHAQMEGVQLRVFPRRLQRHQADPASVVGTPHDVEAALRALRDANLTDTRVDLQVAANSIGLTDTTFVAVSGDHSTVAFGEGVAQFGRVMLFGVRADSLKGTSVHTEDLVGNAAERVIGLGLNADGSLGIARGNQVYLFSNTITGPQLDPSLRLEGIVQSGSPAGGAALHPTNSGYPNVQGSRLGFASGIDEANAPYIDVLDAYSFQPRHRIILRDPVIGTLIAVPVAPGDPQSATVALRLFALTNGGVVHIDLAATDLQ